MSVKSSFGRTESSSGQFDEVLQRYNPFAPLKEINRRLDALITIPNRIGGSITNTSIEGGQTNPFTGIRGDWTGTVFDPIFEACGKNEEIAGMFFGNVWKMRIIAREEQWIGIRFDPTFSQRGVTLQGKTYFLDSH